MVSSTVTTYFSSKDKKSILCSLRLREVPIILESIHLPIHSFTDNLPNIFHLLGLMLAVGCNNEKQTQHTRGDCILVGDSKNK